MNITINGQAFDISNLTSQDVNQALTLFLSSEQLKQTFAVALNGDFVSRNDYASTAIKADDKLDVVFPIQGG